MTASPSASSILSRSRAFIHTLFDPSDHILDMGQQRQARLLNYLLLPIFVSLAFLSNWDYWADSYYVYFSFNIVWIGVAYLLNRAGYYKLAALIPTVLLAATGFFNFLLKVYTGVPAPEVSLMRVFPAILVAYLLLPLREIVLLSAINLIGIALIGLLSPVYYPLLPVTFVFTFITALLMITAGVSRLNYIRQIAQQEKELTESEARFRSLLDATFETIIVHRNSVILDVNPPVEALLGYTPDEVIGKHAYEFVHPDYHHIIDEKAAVDAAEPYELLVQHKNGSLLHVELRGKAQTYRGEVVRVVAIRDITERKIQQELALEREKVRVLQNFIGNLSHDLRTPLSVINTSIYLIDRLAREPERQRHQIEVLHAQAHRMQRLLEDLISIARLDKADTRDFQYRWMNVNPLIAEAVATHQSLALRKNQSLECDLADALPEVLLDAEQFGIAVKHLILNGLNYTAEGGTVQVRTYTKTRNVHVVVSDNGVGIEPDDLPHIFDYFFRADPARGDAGGTGIGLSLARKIVEAHGGAIHATSTPGTGSVFTILLPIPPEADAL